LTLGSVEEQILSLFTVRVAFWLDVAQHRRADAVATYGASSLLA
jgi:hypothetical protein